MVGSILNMIMGEKINVWSANKQSNELHTEVSVAFSYLIQCRVKTSGKLLFVPVLRNLKTNLVDAYYVFFLVSGQLKTDMMGTFYAVFSFRKINNGFFPSVTI